MQLVLFMIDLFLINQFFFDFSCVVLLFCVNLSCLYLTLTPCLAWSTLPPACFSLSFHVFCFLVLFLRRFDLVPFYLFSAVDLSILLTKRVVTKAYFWSFCLPPSVADNRKCVPYFLMRLSVMVWVVGLRPRRRMFLMNSGVSGNGDSRKSLRSTAKLFTFHLPNSLKRIKRQAVIFFHLSLH